MGVITTYDEKRDALRDRLNESLRLAKELLDEDTWGYENMKEDYAVDVYMAVRKARDAV
jgi:hypothetical protein